MGRASVIVVIPVLFFVVMAARPCFHDRNTNFVLFSEYESPHFEMVHLLFVRTARQCIAMD